METIVLVVVLLLALLLLFRPTRRVLMTESAVGWEVLTVERMPGREYRVEVLMAGEIVVFVGSCTVWHELPDFRRCSTLTESRLAGIWSKAEHERKNAHNINRERKS